MVFGYVYEAGLRPNNQDALLVRSTKLTQGELVMAVVCDGMGGEECGEQASYECVNYLDCWFDRELLPVFLHCDRNYFEKRKLIQSKAFSAFYMVNRKLFTMMRQKKGHMGTTASMLILYGDEYYLFHLGDSRIYFAVSLLGKTIFWQRTKDHAINHSLFRCLGLNREYRPDCCCGITKCHNFLLCTDGFSNLYHRDVWSSCLGIRNMTDSEIIIKRLKELAKDNLRKQEKDNISAIWIRR